MRAFRSKAAGFAALVAVLWAASQMATQIVQDRLNYRGAALASIAASHAGAQRVIGPALRVPYELHYQDEEAVGTEGKAGRRTVTRREPCELIVLPESLDVHARLRVEPRTRGVFRINAFESEILLTGRWRIPDQASFPRARADAVLHRPWAARLTVAVSEARGLRAVDVRVDDRPLTVAAAAQPVAGQAAIDAELPSDLASAGTRTFTIAIRLAGLDALSVLPIGQDNQVRIESDWPHPSFDGASLPDQRKVDARGFEATWRIPAIATRAPSGWAELLRTGARSRDRAASDVDEQAVGVRLIDPVDAYTLTDRATKYAMLFVVLTVGGFGLFELFGGLRLHPVQYLLVGTSLILFYLLLLSLSERIGFGPAYAASACAEIGLIAYYLRFALGNWWQGIRCGAGLAATYGCLYLLLKSEHNALLVGSLALFGLLATTLVLTRRVDWFGLFEGRAAAPAAVTNA